MSPSTIATTKPNIVLVVRAPNRERAEWAMAEAFAAGVVGLEEREDDGIELDLYLNEEDVARVRDALAPTGVEVAERGVVPATDWSEAWKDELKPIRISERLVVQPSFCPVEDVAGQHVVVVDPGQAFGTGAHESTYLALVCLEASMAGLPQEARILDVGTGTGVLALAALRLSDATAVGFDLDPLAAVAARRNAGENQLSPRFDAFTGGIEALASGTRFDLVVANMLRRETEPILDAIASHTQPGGQVVLSGLLLSEFDRVVTLSHAYALTVEATHTRDDASGDTWLGMIMTRSDSTTS